MPEQAQRGLGTRAYTAQQGEPAEQMALNAQGSEQGEPDSARGDHLDEPSEYHEFPLSI